MKIILKYKNIAFAIARHSLAKTKGQNGYYVRMQHFLIVKCGVISEYPYDLQNYRYFSTNFLDWYIFIYMQYTFFSLHHSYLVELDYTFVNKLRVFKENQATFFIHFFIVCKPKLSFCLADLGICRVILKCPSSNLSSRG